MRNSDIRSGRSKSITATAVKFDRALKFSDLLDLVGSLPRFLRL